MTTQPWTSGIRQQAGMWLQVELPEPVRLTKLQFESGPSLSLKIRSSRGQPPRTAVGRDAPPPAIQRLKLHEAP